MKFSYSLLLIFCLLLFTESFHIHIDFHHHHRRRKAPVATHKPIIPPAQREKNDLIESIRGQIGRLDPITNEPSDTNLVDEIKSIGKSNFIQCNANQLSRELTPYKLPQDVVNKINTIIYMQSTTFEGFNFIVKGGDATLTQYAGAARNVKGTVQIAFVNTITTGQLVSQYQNHVYRSKQCKFCWHIFHGFRCCSWKTQTIRVPIGFTVDQLERIQDALQSAGKTYIIQQLDNPPAQFKNYPRLVATDERLTLFEVQKFPENVDELVNVVEKKLQEIMKN